VQSQPFQARKALRVNLVLTRKARRVQTQSFRAHMARQVQTQPFQTHKARRVQTQPFQTHKALQVSLSSARKARWVQTQQFRAHNALRLSLSLGRKPAGCRLNGSRPTRPARPVGCRRRLVVVCDRPPGLDHSDLVLKHQPIHAPAG
jgi:hypothetical protein